MSTKDWETLANEAIADARHWKKAAREYEKAGVSLAVENRELRQMVQNISNTLKRGEIDEDGHDCHRDSLDVDDLLHSIITEARVLLAKVRPERIAE